MIICNYIIIGQLCHNYPQIIFDILTREVSNTFMFLAIFKRAETLTQGPWVSLFRRQCPNNNTFRRGALSSLGDIQTDRDRQNDGSDWYPIYKFISKGDKTAIQSNFVFVRVYLLCDTVMFIWTRNWIEIPKSWCISWNTFGCSNINLPVETELHYTMQCTMVLAL